MMHPHFSGRRVRADADFGVGETVLRMRIAKLLKFLIWCGLFWCFSACGDEFTPASKVEGLRVLAIRTSLPAMSVTDTTTLDALVYPESGVDYQWSICLASAGSASAFDCISEDLECSLGTQPTVELNLTTLATACLGEGKADEVLQQIADNSGQDAAVVYARLQVSKGDDSIEAVKSIRIQKEPPFNTNPVLVGIKRDGANWGEEPIFTANSKTKFTLLPIADEKSRETYEGADGETAAEEFTYAWYATESNLSQVFTYDDYPSNVLETPKVSDEEQTRESTLWLVVRDGRGGVDWLKRRMVVYAQEIIP
ncbi:MAG: hypothetical protein HUU55_16720 [Myxococcales bacterium]|nr:hypothetical protein [Myxococcales bacterium]